MKKTKILFVVVWLLLVAVFLLSGQPMAYAVETGGIGVMPAATKDYPKSVLVCL